MTKLYGTVHTGNQDEAMSRALKEAEKYFGTECVNVDLLRAEPYTRTHAGVVTFATDYVAWAD